VWSEEDFFAAFEEAGMLTDALYTPSLGDARTVKVGFAQPDTLLLNEMVQVAQYQIEYETAVMPDLADGESIVIGGETYLVRGEPQKKGDGYYSTAELIKT